MPIPSGFVRSVTEKVLISATVTVTSHCLMVSLSSAKTKYVTGSVKSTSTPLSGKMVAPSEIVMIGASEVTSVPLCTSISIVANAELIIAALVCSSRKKVRISASLLSNS